MKSHLESGWSAVAVLCSIQLLKLIEQMTSEILTRCVCVCVYWLFSLKMEKKILKNLRTFDIQHLK